MSKSGGAGKTQIYVLQVLTGKETLVRKDLQFFLSSHPDISADDRVIFPRREMVQRKLGRSFKKLQPLFPGYLFWITANPPPDVFRDISLLPHVMHFLPSRTHRQPLSEDDRHLLRPFLRHEGITRLIPVQFDENDLVVVKEGVLKGQEGRIVKVDRRRRRMKVSLTLYGDGRVVDFGYIDLGRRSESSC